MSRRRREKLDRLLVGLALLAIWELVSLGAGQYWVTSPWRTVLGVYQLVESGALVGNAFYTLREAV